MDRDQDIGEIERELALLRARHASYARAAVIMKVMARVLIALAAVAALAFAVKLFLSDTLYGVFFVSAVVIFGGAAIWLVGLLGLRWIDFVSQSPRGIYNPYFFTPDIDPDRRARSDAELIEWQIADRERQLAELRTGAHGR
ncbi:MAG TPA: hypothetical protein VMU69_16355 [Bradyrhizobium sp.]|nr:hypothetical protein [Bradyrhizobium sp.]